MPGQLTTQQRSYRIAAANVNPGNANKNEIPRYRGVILSAEDEVKLPTAANAIPEGIVFNDERLYDAKGDGGSQAGRQIAVHNLVSFPSIELNGTVAAGDRLILDAGGYAIKIPAVAGTYNVIGFAQRAGVDGDVIAFRAAYHVVIVP